MTTPPRQRPAVYVTLTVVVALGVLVGAMWFGGAWPRPEIPGLPSAGTLTTLGLPLVRAFHDVCAVVTIGILLTAVVLTDDGETRHRVTRAAGLWAVGWAGAAVLTALLTLSDLLGLPLDEALASGFLTTFGLEVPQGQAFLLVTLVALLVAAATSLTLGTWGRALLLVVAVLAVLPPAYVGHSASAADHNLAVSSLMVHIAAVTLWAGGLFGLVTLLRGAPGLTVAVRRFSALALCCFVAVGFSGLVNAWVRLGGLPEFWQSRYGLLVLGKMAALVALGWFGLRHRRATIAALEAGTASRPFLRLAAVEIGVMTCTVALAVALSRTPPPRAGEVHGQHELLGYALPAMTPWRVLTEIRLDPVAVLAVAGVAAAYLTGVRRLTRRGETWPVGRTVAALAGLLVLLYGASGGVAAYGPAVFSVQALQYTLLGAVGPALLALGVPLAPLHEAMPLSRRLAAGPVTARLAHPAAALAVYAVPYLLLYVAPLFDPAQSSLAVRLVAQLVLVASATWFFCVALGLGPLPVAIGRVTRIRMLLGALALQVWVGLVLLFGPIQGQGWYEALAIPWAPDRVPDQRTGVLIGVVPAAVTIAVLLGITLARRGSERVAPADAPSPASVTD
ncbi:cytochrome c oxidase assembly protein [Sphaerisporangium sp. TRM90804]|uniref:cytochrome c oxidase assembly protein n=1 Tax=Sphaerisporangium sp. TRM90804 TaxID=3031113 RepID=UPI002449761D|nr:cytochrome c oxidase assembly protein [Sphaerisporangium sp. TRM90804]MDH2425468.1 cytochrome c oxidase assembly protein [Sphaerisporangium sp. TRM90804]